MVMLGGLAVPFSCLARWISFTSDCQTLLPASPALTATTTRVITYPRTTRVPDQHDPHNRVFCRAYEVPSWQNQSQ